MRKVLSRAAIILCLFFCQVPYSYCQDTQKEKQKKDVNGNVLDEDNTPEEEPVVVEKRKSTVPRVTLGLETGGGIAMLDIDGTRSNANTGGTIGAFADIRMAGKFYVQPGIFYVMNGGSDVVLYPSFFRGYPLQINMVEVPVTVTYKTRKPGARIRFTVGVTGYYGYNVEADINGARLLRGNSADDDIKATEFGVGLNVGLELRNGMFFRIKTQRGLSDLQPDPNGKSIYTESDVVTIGYLFHKKTRHQVPMGSGDGYIEGKM